LRSWRVDALQADTVLFSAYKNCDGVAVGNFDNFADERCG
jgi:hypothetical protein